MTSAFLANLAAMFMYASAGLMLLGVLLGIAAYFVR